MAKLVNLAQMTTTTTGTGPVTLASATTGFRTFTAAGVSSGDTVSYSIYDSNQHEYGTGVVNVAGSVVTMTRMLGGSTTGALLNLTGSATVSLSPRAEDLQYPTPNQTMVTAATYSAVDADDFIFIRRAVAGVATITFPSALARGGRILYVKDAAGTAGTYNHILNPVGADLFQGGASSYVFSYNYEGHEFIPVQVGAQWTWLLK
jgi:hypothetical protein